MDGTETKGRRRRRAQKRVEWMEWKRRGMLDTLRGWDAVQLVSPLSTRQLAGVVHWPGAQLQRVGGAIPQHSAPTGHSTAGAAKG